MYGIQGRFSYGVQKALCDVEHGQVSFGYVKVFRTGFLRSPQRGASVLLLAQKVLFSVVFGPNSVHHGSSADSSVNYTKPVNHVYRTYPAQCHQEV
jgi:hypothetical protein